MSTTTLVSLINRHDFAYTSMRETRSPNITHWGHQSTCIGLLAKQPTVHSVINESPADCLAPSTGGVGKTGHSVIVPMQLIQGELL